MENSKPSYQELEKKIEALELKLTQQAGRQPDVDTLYHTVFNKSFDAIVMLDENKIISDCNCAYEQLTGYSRQELIGMDVAELMHPDHRDDLNLLAEKLEDCGSLLLERRIIHKTGTSYWIEVNGNYIFINGKKLYLVIIRDISHKKRAEKKLRDSKDFCFDMLDSMFTMLAVIEPGGEIIFANKPALDRVEIGLEDIQGKLFHTVFWWQYSNEVPPLIKKDVARCANGEKISRTIKVNTKTDGLIWINFRLSPVLDGNGGIKFIVAEGMDITRRRQAEAELSDQKNFLSYMAAAVPGIFYAFDRDGKLLHWNQEFEKLVESSAREMESATFLDFFKGENLGVAQNGIDEVFQGDQTTREIEITSRTGKKTSFFMTGKKVEFQNKEYIVGVGIDLTERKTLESHIRQSQKMEAVGQLVGGVAHDFNNMLGVIFGHIQLAQGKLSPEDLIFKNLETIRKAAERSASLTRQLLAFSRKEIIEPKPIRVNSFIDSMLKIISRLIGEHIDPVFLPGKDLWRVKMDSSQVDQLVANLSINARDAMPDGGKFVIETQNITFDKAYCSRHLGFIPGRFVLISISDNGMGMDEETRSHIFEPFYTTKERGRGTGMGLATTYGIIKQNNGFINVYSELGCGTTFKLYLPRWVGEEETSVPSAEKKESSITGKILLVEDDEMVCELTHEILNIKGHIVTAATSPEQALEYCRSKDQEFQLLLTDVIMPGMNGRELKKEIEHIFPKIKTLFMSGYTTNIIAHQGILDDAVNFISKPFHPDELLRKVSEVLEE